ncbi:hypothetical protein CsatB_018267 [Cannabis sativa]
MDEFKIVEVWVMKKYGDPKSWFKYLSVSLIDILPNLVCPYSSSFWVSFFSNGILVISCIEAGIDMILKSKGHENMCPRLGASDLTTYVESIFQDKKGDNCSYVSCFSPLKVIFNCTRGEIFPKCKDSSVH